MRVALVHDYLREYGGAERVLEALHEIFPQAPIYTAYYNPQGLGVHAQRLKGWDIRTSWLQKIPGANRLVSPLRIFAPKIFEGFNLSEYDLVISSCSIYFAKAVVTKPKALHISYIHTPPRYLYGYTTSFNYKKKWWTKVAGEIMNHFLRIYDFEISQRPDILVANSENVAARIKKFYRREAVVIYPPVDLPSFPRQPEAGCPLDRKRESIKNGSRIKSFDPELKTEGYGMTKEGYYLSVGRLVRGKGADVIVEACTKLGVPLKIVGTGPEFESLKKIAGEKVEFLGQVEDEKMPEIYAQALATIVASEDEDFGIVPVESMASGTPVIAVKAGGFLETVVEGKTGLFFGQDGKATVESLMEALQRFNNSNYLINVETVKNCQRQAEKFSKERFKKEILELIEKNIH